MKRTLVLGRSIGYKLVAVASLTLGVLGATGCASDVEDPVVNPVDEPQQPAPSTAFSGKLAKPSDGTSIEINPADVGSTAGDLGARQPGLRNPVPSY
jgi:hypothetical protein